MNSEHLLIKRLGLAPGDKIVSPKSEWRVIQHHAIYLGQDHYGGHLICENDAREGVKLTSASTFFQKYPEITRIERFKGDFYRRKEAVSVALSKLGRPYDLINYNCEHFVNDVILNKPSSTQVKNAVGIAIALLILKQLIKN